MTFQPQSFILQIPRRMNGTSLAVAGRQNLQVSHKRLQRSQNAVEALLLSGLEWTTAVHFFFGLYSSSGHQERYMNVLIFPLMDADGQPRKRWIRHDLVGITRQWPMYREVWSTGEAATYWFTPERGQRDVVICDSFQIGWRLWQLLQSHELSERFCLITRSTTDAVPEEWLSPHFWQPWRTIYFARSAERPTDLLQAAHEGLAGRTVHIVQPEGKTWLEFVLAGGTLDDLTVLVRDPVSAAPPQEITPSDGIDPLVTDVHMTSVAGQLYYPYYRHRIGTAATPRAPELLVLRSDGKTFRPVTLHEPGLSAAGASSPFPALLVDRLPVPSWSSLTFRQDTIAQYQHDQRITTGELAPLTLFALIHLHLSRAVTWPEDDRIHLLAYVVMLSYVQALFPLVPVVSLVGPAESGKTRLASAMLDLGCNAALLSGTILPSTVAQVNDSLGGLLILDDMDDLLEASPPLVALLRASSHQLLGRRTYVTGHESAPCNTFGVKVVTTRRPLPLALQSCALVIPCKLVPRETPQDWEMSDNYRIPMTDPDFLRQQLHLWAMRHASVTHAAEQSFSGTPSLLGGERFVPLWVLAEVIGNDAGTKALQRFISQ